MNRRSKKKKGKLVKLRVWTYAQGRTALPYIASIVRSLRDHRLEAARHRHRAAQLAARPGSKDRDTLIGHEDALRDAQKADERYQEALAELQGLDIYSLDAIAGQALIPFVHENQLAWFIYDLFDAEPMRFWRFQTDPLETRRAVTRAQEDRDQSPLVV